MLRTSTGMLLVAAIVALSVSAVYATPAPWRGQESSTLATWCFGTNANPACPDECVGQEPAPQATILNSSTYKDTLNGCQGIWPLGGQIFVPLQYGDNSTGEHQIWVQLAWCEENAGATPLVEGWLGPTRVDPVRATLVCQEDWPTDGADGTPNPWRLGTYSLSLTGPDIATVHITHCIYVDNMTIETNPVPEPGVLLLTGLSGLLLLRRPRR